jgi:hypothetical protein
MKGINRIKARGVGEKRNNRDEGDKQGKGKRRRKSELTGMKGISRITAKGVGRLK